MKKAIVLLVTINITLLVTNVMAGTSSSANFKISLSAINSNTSLLQSNQYQLASSAGQGISVGRMSSTTFRVISGYLPYVPFTDSDGDGMPNRFELIHNLNAYNNTDANDDPDLDGLTNLQEFQNGTDPQSSDSDGDGMDDGFEVEYGLDPLMDDSGLDNDRDGLNNLAEYQAGTAPNNPDTDGDGIPDGYEVANNLNPLLDDANLINGDGISNYQAYLNSLAKGGYNVIKLSNGKVIVIPFD